MTLQMIRFETDVAEADTAAEQIEALFTALTAAQPVGIRYTAFREQNAPRFTLILELDDGVDNPLPSIPEAASFRSWLATNVPGQAGPKACVVVGEYPS